MATAIAAAVKANKELNDALDHYEMIRANSSTFEGASLALMEALTRARKLGWAVEELEKAASEVLP